MILRDESSCALTYPQVILGILAHCSSLYEVVCKEGMKNGLKRAGLRPFRTIIAGFRHAWRDDVIDGAIRSDLSVTIDL